MEMEGKWFYQRNNIKAYLMDYHRPYFHGNINESNNKIFVIEDGCPSFKECPTAEDDRIYEQMQQFDAEDENSDSDYDSEIYSDEEEAKQELNDLKGSDDEDQDNARPEADDDDDEEDAEKKRLQQRKKEEKQAKDMRKLKRQNILKFKHYYRGSFYGNSTSSVLY